MASPLNPQQVQQAEKQSLKKPYLYRLFRSADKFVNAVTGGNEDETISDRVWRVTQAHPNYHGWNPGVWLAKGLNAGLNVVQKNHGAMAAAGSLADAEKVEDQEAKALGVKPD